MALLFKGQVEGIGSDPHMAAKDADGKTVAEKQLPHDTTYEALFEYLIGWVEAHLGGQKPAAVGHRVVHGGTAFSAPARIGHASAAVSARPASPAAQSRGDSCHRRHFSISATGRVL